MNIAGNIAAISVLLLIMVQDFRTRTISAWLLPAITLCLFLPSVNTAEMSLLFTNFTFNCILLTIQFVLLWLIISARNKKWTQIINTQIGIGDILLLVCLTPFFSPLNYFVLFIVAMICSLIVALLMKAVNPRASEYIPFAGVFAVPLIILCTARLIFPENISFSSSEWLNCFLNS